MGHLLCKETWWDRQFCERVRRLRKRMGVSQKEFGAMVAASRETVIEWEQNKPPLYYTAWRAQVRRRVFQLERLVANISMADRTKPVSFKLPGKRARKERVFVI